VEAPSVLAALGLIETQLGLLCGSHVTLGNDASFDLLACLAALQQPGDSYEHRNELFPDESFELIYGSENAPGATSP
jgi:hypothetical protein